MANASAFEMREIRKLILLPNWQKFCNFKLTDGRDVIVLAIKDGKHIPLASYTGIDEYVYMVYDGEWPGRDALASLKLAGDPYYYGACISDQIREDDYSNWRDPLMQYLNSHPDFEPLYSKKKIAEKTAKHNKKQVITKAKQFTKADQLQVAESIVDFLLNSPDHSYLINLVLELARKPYYRKQVVPVTADPTADKIIASLGVFNIDQEQLKTSMAGHDNEAARRFVAKLDTKYSLAGLLDKDEKVRAFAELQREEMKKEKARQPKVDKEL